jgi:L-lactate dehydrogenase complex protein LldF
VRDVPRVLVSVIGIEKLVPTFRDLEVFLQLLPRSSTGERMNPYTSLWTGVTEGDGPQELHVVLLDNDRTRVLADTVGRQALHCIRCSACLNVCPVYSRTRGHAYGSVYPGPIGAILTPQLVGIENAASLPFASSLYGVCYEVCPVKIDIPTVLLHLRAKAVRNRESAAERAVMPGVAWLFGSRAVHARAAVGPARAAPARLPRCDSRATAAARGLDPHPRPEAHRPPELSRVVEEERQMTAARDEILARIRAVNRTSPSAVQLEYRRVGGLDSYARVDLFARRVADYRADVRVLGVGDLATAIRSAFLERGAMRIGVPPGLPAAWRADSLELVEDRGLTARDLAALDGVVTGCTVAIAETGTIVLAGGGPAEGRRALSLVPDLHICIVRSPQIVELVTEATVAVADLVVRERRPVTFISGPPATSDIELSRVEGVHGPRTLVVLIVNEEEA